MDQTQFFLESEADEWYERNKAALDGLNLDTDLPLRLVDLYNLQPVSVLEIGASNGYRLAALGKKHAVRLIGVEPSRMAIEDGRKKFPEVELLQGLAHAVPLQETFDLVIINFVFYIMDRRHLFATAAEIDRLVAEGGNLIIGDFLPSSFLKVRYHHTPEHQMLSFKQNYADLFTASGLYHAVSLLTGPHALATRGLSIEAGENERMGAWLLHKSSTGLYTETHL